ncbi:MAG: SDR family oxidoreductase [Pseudomonadales bacterium]|nr:SDR family oxidoreductase [Pseudomonadales bacterium]
MTKTILITGASSGFGAACARRFAAPGHALVLTARRQDRLLALQKELQTQCPVHCLGLDITDADGVDGLPESLPEAFREIDVLINNAGLALGLEPAQESRMADWETMVNTNILGLIRMTRRILPGMVARNRGHIINIGSTAGDWPYAGGNVYGASKAFVQQFSRNLRTDLHGTAIRVSTINPGMAETEFSRVRFRQDQDMAEKVYQGATPLSAEDIAEIIHWVNSVPPHVNINALEVMPVCQSWGGLSVSRNMA